MKAVVYFRNQSTGLFYVRKLGHHTTRQLSKPDSFEFWIDTLIVVTQIVWFIFMGGWIGQKMFRAIIKMNAPFQHTGRQPRGGSFTRLHE